MLYTKHKCKGVLNQVILFKRGSSLNICPTLSLYMGFIDCGSRDQNQYLIIHKASHRN